MTAILRMRGWEPMVRWVSVLRHNWLFCTKTFADVAVLYNLCGLCSTVAVCNICAFSTAWGAFWVAQPPLQLPNCHRLCGFHHPACWNCTQFLVIGFVWCWTTPHHNRFTALLPEPPGWAGARRELLGFMVQGKIDRGRHTDYPAGRHSVRTNHSAHQHPPFLGHRQEWPSRLELWCVRPYIHKKFSRFPSNLVCG